MDDRVGYSLSVYCSAITVESTHMHMPHPVTHVHIFPLLWTSLWRYPSCHCAEHLSTFSSTDLMECWKSYEGSFIYNVCLHVGILLLSEQSRKKKNWYMLFKSVNKNLDNEYSGILELADTVEYFTLFLPRFRWEDKQPLSIKYEVGLGICST